uniref:Uncharacterized protein n=1 Tax=Cacopsylla melanoneura TaxID=428564 RepID=A0A8D8TVU4_9HEMI
MFSLFYLSEALRTFINENELPSNCTSLFSRTMHSNFFVNLGLQWRPDGENSDFRCRKDRPAIIDNKYRSTINRLNIFKLKNLQKRRPSFETQDEVIFLT